MATNNVWNSQTPAQIAKGGIGRTAVDKYTVVCGGVTNTAPLQNVSGTGTAGETLMSNGPGSLPTWTASPIMPSNSTAFSAEVVFAAIPANTNFYGNLGTAYIDPGSNVFGGFYNVPSDGTYIFFYNYLITGSLVFQVPDCYFYVVIGGGPKGSYNINIARTASSSGQGTASASFIYQCSAGDKVQPAITVYVNYSSAGVSCGGVLGGYKLY
jgi:hypothetical protein